MSFVNSSMTKAKIKEVATAYGVNTPNLNKTELVNYINAAISDVTRGKYNANPNQTISTSCVNEVWTDTSIPWLDHLNQHGWVTVPIPGYVDYTSEFFSWIERHSSGFNRHDPATWDKIPNNSRGVFKDSIGYEEWVWKIREACVPVFCELYKCQPEDLLCSLDGGCFLKTAPYKEKFKHWLHNDSPRGNVGICAQGIVNLATNYPNDGGLLLVEGSHKVYDQYMTEHQSAGYMWERSNMDDPLFSGMRLIHICAPAGSITLFNGKMFHCNYKGRGGGCMHSFTGVQCNCTKSLYRMCVYVSMQPRCMATQEELSKRIELYSKRKMTGHWCYGPYLQANSLFRLGIGESAEQPDEISDLRKRLIGYS